MIRYHLLFSFGFFMFMWMSFSVLAEDNLETRIVSHKDVWQDFCTFYVEHVPAEDVAYKPGLDVKGKPVVPADLDAHVVTVPKAMEFDLDIDVAKYLGIPVPAGVLQETKIGRIRVENGQVTFNDEPIEGPAKASLRETCADAHQKNLESDPKPSYKDLAIYKHQKKNEIKDDSTSSKTEE